MSVMKQVRNWLEDNEAIQRLAHPNLPPQVGGRTAGARGVVATYGPELLHEGWSLVGFSGRNWGPESGGSYRQGQKVEDLGFSPPPASNLMVLGAWKMETARWAPVDTEQDWEGQGQTWPE